MLEYETEIGLKVLALIHSGKLKKSCIECDEFEQDTLSCGKISENIVYEDDEIGKQYTCPLVYITQYISNFYDELQYMEMFHKAPDYKDMTNRFWEAVKIYKACYNKHLYDDNKDKEKDTDNELKKMKTNFDKRKRGK